MVRPAVGSRVNETKAETSDSGGKRPHWELAAWSALHAGYSGQAINFSRSKYALPLTSANRMELRPMVVHEDASSCRISLLI